MSIPSLNQHIKIQRFEVGRSLRWRQCNRSWDLYLVWLLLYFTPRKFLSELGLWKKVLLRIYPCLELTSPVYSRPSLFHAMPYSSPSVGCPNTTTGKFTPSYPLVHPLSTLCETLSASNSELIFTELSSAQLWAREGWRSQLFSYEGKQIQVPQFLFSLHKSESFGCLPYK